MDLKELQGFSVADQNELAEAFSRTFAKLYVFPKPVVAAVNGAAIAGGLFVALASDYRVARAGAWWSRGSPWLRRDRPRHPEGRRSDCLLSWAPGSFKASSIRTPNKCLLNKMGFRVNARCCAGRPDSRAISDVSDPRERYDPTAAHCTLTHSCN